MELFAAFLGKLNFLEPENVVTLSAGELGEADVESRVFQYFLAEMLESCKQQLNTLKIRQMGDIQLQKLLTSL